MVCNMFTLIFSLIYWSFLNTFSLCVILLITFFVYYSHKSVHKYWSSLGIKSLPWSFYFTNFIYTVLNLNQAKGFVKGLYDYFEDSSIGGLPSLTSNYTLIVTDPEIVEHVLVKDFTSFVNHGLKIEKELNPLTKSLFTLENVQWKKLRTKMTPTFTSSKLKDMHTQLLESSDKLMDYISIIEKEDSTIEVKNIASRFTVDFIASSAFGLDTNTILDKESVYNKMVESAFSPTFFRQIINGIALNSPKICKLFRIKFFPQKLEDFFMSLVRYTYQYREENNIRRKDFFQTMMDLRKADQENGDDELKFDEDIMAANCFVFLFAGYETVASTCSFLLYELALNSDIQTKVYEEIVEKTNKYGGEATYEAVKEMTLLTQAVSETLRKYPPAYLIMRECNEPYLVPKHSSIIPKGTNIIIPVHALQTDPKYFPNPEKFDPHRFSDSEHIVKGTYLPFGDGPRMCIASRLAQQEIKVVVSKILLKYNISVHQSVPYPLKFQVGTWNVKGGLKLKFQKRT